MATPSTHIPTGPGYRSLAFSIIVMVIVPTFGLWVGVTLLTQQPLFQNVWESKYDLCGRLWLLASFISTTLVTVAIMFEIITDERFNTFRTQRNFSSSVKSIIIISIILPLAGLAAALIPYRAHGMWIMKALALGIALGMLGLDIRIKNIVRRANQQANDTKSLHKSLEREFAAVVRLVDIPTTFAIALVMALSALYLLFLPTMTTPTDVSLPPYHNDSEIFVQGLSSGAVAVELWFANFLFWMMLRRHDD